MVELSGVVPTYNNESTIEECLRGLILNKVDEVIVSDGGSNDKTLEIAKRFSQVRTVNSGKGIARGREAGWRNSRGQLILFLDADAYILPGVVETLRSHLSDKAVAGVSCIVGCANCTRLLPKFRDLDFKLAYADLFDDSGIASCTAEPFLCGLYARKALESVNGFDVNYEYAEDMKLLQKLRSKGYRALVVQDAVVFHHHREKLRELCLQLYHHGFGRRFLVDEAHERFYGRKQIRRFAHAFLTAAPRVGPEVLLCYPLYRFLTEMAFSFGYFVGRKQDRTSP